MVGALNSSASTALFAVGATALALPVASGVSIWPALARHLASTISPAVAAGGVVYFIVSRLAAPAAG